MKKLMTVLLILAAVFTAAVPVLAENETVKGHYFTYSRPAGWKTYQAEANEELTTTSSWTYTLVNSFSTALFTVNEIAEKNGYKCSDSTVEIVLDRLKTGMGGKKISVEKKTKNGLSVWTFDLDSFYFGAAAFNEDKLIVILYYNALRNADEAANDIQGFVSNISLNQ